MNRQLAYYHVVFAAAIGLWFAMSASAQLRFTVISNTPRNRSIEVAQYQQRDVRN